MYGVTLSDGSYLLVGKGGESESETIKMDAFAIRLSATGVVKWAWRSDHPGMDVAIGATQLPNGGSVIVAGFAAEGGVRILDLHEVAKQVRKTPFWSHFY